MLCMCGKKIPNNMLQMNVTVTECYDEKVGAKISCAPLGEEPITYEWYNSNKNNVELNFDSTKFLYFFFKYEGTYHRCFERNRCIYC